MDYSQQDAQAFGPYVLRQLSGRWSDNDIDDESRRIGSLFQTLERCHVNGSIVLHKSPRSRNLLPCIESIEIIDGTALEMALQLMKVVDRWEFDERDIWDSTTLNVTEKDPTFGLWRVWFTLYRLGFKPSHASVNLACGKRVWHDVFIGITKWTSLANTLPYGAPTYYAPEHHLSSNILTFGREAGLQWWCEKCKGVISTEDVLEHVKVCDMPYGRRCQHRYRCVTNGGQMPFHNNFEWNVAYAYMPASNAAMHHNAEPFRAFSFHGPQDRFELLDLDEPEKHAEERVLSMQDLYMSTNDWSEWKRDGLNGWQISDI
jgi:hypothetical protein